MVAGGGDRPHYEALAESLGVGPRIRWLDVVHDIPLVYELADAFVMASSYETFSLVTFEAAASALPVLATAVNGVRELIEDGENGFLITAEPPASVTTLLSGSPSTARVVRVEHRSSWIPSVASIENRPERRDTPLFTPVRGSLRLM